MDLSDDCISECWLFNRSTRYEFRCQSRLNGCGTSTIGLLHSNFSRDGIGGFVYGVMVVVIAMQYVLLQIARNLTINTIHNPSTASNNQIFIVEYSSRVLNARVGVQAGSPKNAKDRHEDWIGSWVEGSFKLTVVDYNTTVFGEDHVE